jgi:3-methyladenine DNA glycosylase AlkD
MQLHSTLQEIRQVLKDSIDERILTSEKKFFKEEIQRYGVDTATVGKIGKLFFASIKDCPKQDIFELCEELWKLGLIEEAIIACNFSYYVHKKYKPADFVVFERWVNNYVTNWATCDTMCNHTVGTFLEMYPDYMAELKKWAKSPNRWMRRASSVISRKDKMPRTALRYAIEKMPVDMKAEAMKK